MVMALGGLAAAPGISKSWQFWRPTYWSDTD
jgi:hypothetical protein